MITFLGFIGCLVLAGAVGWASKHYICVEKSIAIGVVVLFASVLGHAHRNYRANVDIDSVALRANIEAQESSFNTMRVDYLKKIAKLVTENTAMQATHATEISNLMRKRRLADLAKREAEENQTIMEGKEGCEL